MAGVTCKDCYFCCTLAHGLGSSGQECMYNPPKPIPIGDQHGMRGVMSVRPPVQLDEWCGFFKFKQDGL